MLELIIQPNSSFKQKEKQAKNDYTCRLRFPGFAKRSGAYMNLRIYLYNFIFTKNDLPFDAIITKKAARVLRALNNPKRQTIIKLIQESQPIKVADIYKKLRIEQSVASQQLAILRESRFVNTKRDGHVIYYSLNYDRFAQVDKLSKDVLK
jgi:DNA-binding transcriptional ArsR family regulator